MLNIQIEVFIILKILEFYKMDLNIRVLGKSFLGRNIKERKVEYEKVKDVIQHPRLYKSIKRSTIKAANSYISSKTDKIVDYTNIIRNSGVTIED